MKGKHMQYKCSGTVNKHEKKGKPIIANPTQKILTTNSKTKKLERGYQQERLLHQPTSWINWDLQII